jgi:predicted AAA+ superfamily ATPase
VVKEDVAEVLKRRFFTTESLKLSQAELKQYVVAALKGLLALDEPLRLKAADAEERFAKSYPFHPDLTEVLYSKWTSLSAFQRTRGVLRTFALALRAAEKWDSSPLIGPAVFLPAPGQTGLSEALDELVTVANSECDRWRRPAWTAFYPMS